MTNVLIGRELLERVCHRDNSTRQLARRELRTILTQTAPEVEAVKVVAWLLDHEKGGRAVDLNSQSMQVMQQTVGGVISGLMTVAQCNRIIAQLTGTN